MSTEDGAAVEPYLKDEPMSNWSDGRDFDEGWNAALRAAGKFYGFEPRFSDFTLYMQSLRAPVLLGQTEVAP